MSDIDELRKAQGLRDVIHDEEVKANNYITEHMEAFQANVSLNISAMLIASREYDRIMKAEAGKSLIGEIFLNLIITILPVAGILQKGAVTLTLGKKALERIKIVEDKIDDLINSVRGPISSDTSENQNPEQQSLATSNIAIQNELGDLFDLQQKLNDLSSKLRKLVLKKAQDIRDGKSSDSLIFTHIEAAFKADNLDKIKKVSKSQLQKISDVMLYSLLKKYAEQYFDVKIIYAPVPFSPYSQESLISDFTSGILGVPTLPTDNNAYNSRRIADLPARREADTMTGFNSGQMDEIFKKFGLEWFSQSFSFFSGFSSIGHILMQNYPPIYDYKDIIRYWKKGKVTYKGQTIILN